MCPKFRHAAVYIAMTYKVVSLDPIIVDAIFPTKLSGPCTFNVSLNNAKAPPPEIDLITPKGTTSAGILKTVKMGSNKFTKSVIAPEVLNKLTATTTASIVGNIFNIVDKDSETPPMKVSYAEIFFDKHPNKISKIKIGKML